MDGSAGCFVVMGNGHSSSWWEWFWNRINTVLEKTTSEAPIIADALRKIGDRERAIIKAKIWWEVVAFGDGVVKDNSI